MFDWSEQQMTKTHSVGCSVVMLMVYLLEKNIMHVVDIHTYLKLMQCIRG